MQEHIHIMFSTEFGTELKVIAWDKFKEVFHITTPKSTYFKKLAPNVDYIVLDGKEYLLLASAISLASYSRSPDKHERIYELTAALYSDMSTTMGSILHGLETKLHDNYAAYVQAVQGDLNMLGTALGRTINATYSALNYGNTDSISEVLGGDDVIITEPDLPEAKYPQEPITHTEQEKDYD